jgi:hypothetical protein
MLNDGNRRQHARHTLAARVELPRDDSAVPGRQVTGDRDGVRPADHKGSERRTWRHRFRVGDSGRRTRVRRSTAGNASELARPDSNQRAAD